jgi:adenylyl-sulfate kinase
MSLSENIFPFQSKISSKERNQLLNQRPYVIWFTGLSSSGKSTLATQLEAYLFSKKFKTYLLDGDNLRSGLNKDLDFSESARKENIRRAGEVSKLLLDSGLIVLSAFISPFKEDRSLVRQIIGSDNFIEVFVDCPLPVCEARDHKGLYAKARKGEVKNFTGISSAYEIPENPDVTIKTDIHSIQQSLQILIDFVDPLL